MRMSYLPTSFPFSLSDFSFLCWPIPFLPPSSPPWKMLQALFHLGEEQGKTLITILFCKLKEQCRITFIDVKVRQKLKNLHI